MYNTPPIGIMEARKRGYMRSWNFDNGYGASVIRHEYSLGYEEGLYELAVTKDGKLYYDTPITDDVIGYLTPREVAMLLKKIEALPND